ncbi:MAG TPA: ABC transporter permease [Candidatus Acidoferrum sp.]|nr:ABC transporter permease [Candidatus Acidoferrum sp.]
MNTFLQDIRYSIRMLLKLPGFTTVAVLTLALGIGANAAIFSIVYGTLLQPLPYPHSQQLVMVWSKVKGERNVASVGDFLDWQRQSSVFQYMYAWTGQGFNVANPGTPVEEVSGSLASPGWWTKVLGEPLLLGRDFLPEESQPGKDHVVVLMRKFWARRFGGDRDIIGKQIRLNGESYTVVGVLPPGIEDRGDAELVVPLAFKPEQITNYDNHFLFVMGRLRPGVSLEQAQANMSTVQQNVAAAHPATDKDWTISVEPLHDDFLPPATRTELWLFLGAVGFVLLIACANVANLMLSRSATREKEVAIRAAIGAGRMRILRQFLTESFALALLGAIAGIAVAYAVLQGILAMIPVNTLPYEADMRVNPPVLLFMLAAALLSAGLFGSAPAWQAARLNLADSLKEGKGSATASGSRRLRRVLVVTEFALALCLLTGAGLAIRSFWKLTNQDLGVRTDHVLTFWLDLPGKHFSNVEQITTFYRQIQANVAVVPGITHASISANLPDNPAYQLPFSIQGRPPGELGSNPVVGVNLATPEYFETFGVRVERGRAFNAQDLPGGAPVAVVNEAFVHRYLANVDPLAQQVLMPRLDPIAEKLGPQVALRIVGVFHNVRNQGPRQTDVPEVDIPFWQYPWHSVAMAVRTTGDPRSVLKDVSAAVQGIDSDLPLTRVETMDQIVSLSLADDRWIVTLFAGFGAAALLLAILGVYGVMSYSVAQQTHEIGIRMALGAGRGDVLGLVFKEGLLLAGIGVVIGLGGALALTRLMSNSLFGVSSYDPVTFAGVAALLVAVAAMGCFVPAQRAMRVDPLIALRHE